jgi:hypothetical protein
VTSSELELAVVALLPTTVLFRENFDSAALGFPVQEGTTTGSGPVVDGVWTASAPSGWTVNNKRIRRLWREEGLRVPQRRRKKRLTGIGVVFGAMSPIRPDVIWAMDFQFDTTADGRTLKMLNVIDEFTREALAINVDRCIDADGVVLRQGRAARRRRLCARVDLGHGRAGAVPHDHLLLLQAGQRSDSDLRRDE